MPGYANTSLNHRLFDLVNRFVMDYARDSRGSVSAEHGIGYSKPGFLGYSKSAEMIGAMRLVKGAFDPNGILNPYKVLPPQ